ncbi:MAG: Na/Pi cotransporter family protein [Acidimicrobiia bacterium]|nr:Na/Pi cotransporter family protein [Acidimicrobiia bacterium]NNL12881.1 Na/Pi cotransporter family protein [Acidimicrobiia bacterium]RZV41193.1 MAG: Na/Pi cotransporter family protein [Acidimicrobiia bacterium]
MTFLVAQDAAEIDYVLLFAGLLGGLAIFLLGMDRMTESLRVVAGDRLRGVLMRLTSNRFVGMFTGAGITAVIQSSSVTTVLVVGFISSGLMSFQQSLGVIIGANIGTTVTAQIIAFKVTTYALYAVAGGFAVTFLSKRGDRQAQGAVVLGLGLIFFGMSLMGDAMSPLRSSDTFIDLMASLENPFLGVAVGAGFTAIVQSSSATTGIVIVLAQQGLITTETGIALIMGANVGTAITALMASIGKPREALRAGVAHAMFNVGGAVIWIPFIGMLASFVQDLGGANARQLANAHTLFNVINAVLIVGFIPLFARFIERIVPDAPEEEGRTVRVRYLDRTLLRTPSLALDRARLELLRMADRVRSMLGDILPAVLHGTRWTLLEIEERDDEVDSLHRQIITYLGEISQTRLSERETEELIGLMEATNDLEAIGDLVETNLVALGLARAEQGLTVSAETTQVLSEFHASIVAALDLAMLALTQKNEGAARRVSKMKREVNSLERAATAHQAERLVAAEPDRVANYRLEVDVISTLKRIYYFTKRIARVSVPQEEKAAMTDE